ncbi:hypothetical protein [uncultured Paraglaciecola sp.]|jgi:hypothetical protein|nr:hypothetical protein [uncultured Paraglaciecola sp.]
MPYYFAKKPSESFNHNAAIVAVTIASIQTIKRNKVGFVVYIKW